MEYAVSYIDRKPSDINGEDVIYFRQRETINNNNLDLFREADTETFIDSV